MIWDRNFPHDFNIGKPPAWGWSSHPLLDGERLICLVGGTNSAVVAFHKDTGKELWRPLTAVEIGYAPAVIYTIHGRRELIIWHTDAVSGLEPETGKVLWAQPYPVGGKPQRPEVTIAMPRLEGDHAIGRHRVCRDQRARRFRASFGASLSTGRRTRRRRSDKHRSCACHES